MPGQFANIDTGFPSFTGGESTEQKVDALYSYVFLLLENLRYVLRNLSPENFNQQEMKDYFDQLEANVVIANTIITDELYADFGAIADLTVDELRTDYQRAARYLAGNTGSLDYLHIYDEEIDFITATVKSGAPTEHLHHGNRYFWWRDETKTQMTSLEETEWPVIVYKYDEMVKGTFRFDNVTESGTTTKIPQLILGAGYGQQGHEDRGKGVIRKNSTSFDLWMETAAGKKNGVFIGDNYTDIKGLRRATALNFSDWGYGSFTETVEGNVTYLYHVSFNNDGDPILISDGDHGVTITW